MYPRRRNASNVKHLRSPPIRTTVCDSCAGKAWGFHRICDVSDDLPFCIAVGKFPLLIESDANLISAWVDSSEMGRAEARSSVPCRHHHHPNQACNNTRAATKQHFANDREFFTVDSCPPRTRPAATRFSKPRSIRPQSRTRLQGIRTPGR